MRITKEKLTEVVELIADRGSDYAEDLKRRDLDIFFSDGYDNPEYRTAFFCYKGSPNKLYGHVSTWMNHYPMFVTNYGRFYWNGTTVLKKPPSRIRSEPLHVE